MHTFYKMFYYHIFQSDEIVSLLYINKSKFSKYIKDNQNEHGGSCLRNNSFSLFLSLIEMLLKII